MEARTTAAEPEAAPEAGHAVSLPAGWGVSPVVAWTSVGIAMVATILGYLDRQILSLLVGPIRAALEITDFQFSLLAGMAFGLFYALFGLPIGWLVDRYSRRLIICVGIALWSLATVACGLAQSFGELALARFAVGIGEAALAPAVYSLLADMFPPRRLSLAFGIYGMGSTIGSSLAYTGGGLLIRHFTAVGDTTLPVLGTLQPWQMVFVIVGLPGIVIALLPWLMPDPRRRKQGAAKAPAPRGRLWPFIGRNPRYFACHFAGFGIIALISFGGSAWTPAVLTRHMGMEIGDVGVLMGMVGLSAGVSGFIISGWFVDRWFARGQRDAHLRYYACGLLAVAVLGPIAFLSSSLWVFVPAYAGMYLLLPFSGPAVAHLQMATPPELRGQVSALFGLTFNLIGMCLGPSSVAFLTDFVFHDPMMVHYSMAIMIASMSLLGSVMFWLGLKPSRRALGDDV